MNRRNFLRGLPGAAASRALGTLLARPSACVLTKLRRSLLMICIAVLSVAGAGPAFHAWAPTPPMGWNSWDGFGTTLTEEQARATADVMASELVRHGWQYLVIDIQWYEPNSMGFEYRENAVLTMDEFGRLLPAPNKFPSSVGGKGFSALAAYVHAKNLKFGIHLLRGIPRQAVDRNLPIAGTPYHAADIADKARICSWNTDMYGVEMSKPGAQAYYDSVFALIASWGVDFVKVDNLSSNYSYAQNEAEIEAVRTAIDRSGRPIVFSASPGPTNLVKGSHIASHANTWRISGDFWDNWPELAGQFERLNQWTPFRQSGAWPDADMLPIGKVALGRDTYFTHDEQMTLMTLWSIARSPLMLGADLTKLDRATLALITNDEVLAVNQSSSNNHQLFRLEDGSIGWVADVPGGRDRYVALFNTEERWERAESRRIWKSAPISVGELGPDLPFEVNVTGMNTIAIEAKDSKSRRYWSPYICGDLSWVYADGRTVHVESNSVVDDAKAARLSVPSGALAIRGFARQANARQQSWDDWDAADDDITVSVYGFRDQDLPPLTRPVRLDVTQLGLGNEVRVRDLWDHQDLGSFTGSFAPEIPWHGARLYRVSSAKP